MIEATTGFLKGVFTSELALWIQSIAIVTSAVAAFSFIKESRRIAKKQSTVDLILRMRMDKEYLETRDNFKTLREKQTSLAEYAKDTHKESNERKIILDALNTHEYIASGIAEDALDEEMYKRMLGSVVIKDWKGVETFVMDLRSSIRKTDPKTADRLFIEIQTLAEKWQKEREG